MAVSQRKLAACEAARDFALWTICAVLGLLAGSLGVCVIHLRPQIRGFWMLLGIVLLVASALAFGRWQCHRSWPMRPRWSRGAASLIAACASMLGVLTARLLAKEAFETHPADLDFGLKCYEAGTPCGTNKTFDLEGFSLGHVLQGCLALLLYTPVELWWLWTSPHLALAARWSSLCIIIYPVYNLFKRIILHADYFAVSSFSNNAMEWGMGIMLGAAAGLLASAVMPERVALSPGRHSRMRAMTSSQAWRRGDHARHVAGVLLFVAAVLAGVLTAQTWSARPTSSVQEPDQPGALTVAIMVLAPVDGAVLCVVTGLWLGMLTLSSEEPLDKWLQEATDGSASDQQESYYSEAAC